MFFFTEVGTLRSGDKHSNQLFVYLFCKNDSIGKCFFFTGVGTLRSGDKHSNQLGRSSSFPFEIRCFSSTWVEYVSVSFLVTMISHKYSTSASAWGGCFSIFLVTMNSHKYSSSSTYGMFQSPMIFGFNDFAAPACTSQEHSAKDPFCNWLRSEKFFWKEIYFNFWRIWIRKCLFTSSPSEMCFVACTHRNKPNLRLRTI